MTQSYITSVEIDIAWDWYESGEAVKEFNELGIDLEVIELEGPAGGNPFVRLTSNKSALYHWLVECLGLDDDDMNEFYPNVI